MSVRNAPVRSARLRPALLAILVPLAVLADVHISPRTIICEHRGPDTVCLCSSSSLLRPRRREVDASETVDVLSTGSPSPTWATFAPAAGLVLEGADGSLTTLCDELPPRSRFPAAAVPIETFLHTDSRTFTLTVGTPWLRLPFWGAAVFGAVVALRLAIVVRRRSATTAAVSWRFAAAAAVVALALVAAVVWPRADPYRDVRAPSATDAPSTREALFLRARGTRWHFEKDAILQIPAGDRIVLAVASKVESSDLAPLRGPVRWSANGGFARLDQDTGVLVISPAAPDGAELDVVAEVGPERWPLAGRVRVYRPDEKPLLAHWKQFAEVPCTGTGDWKGSDRIGNLTFRRDGRFTVTAVPFERVVDYAGTYQYEAGGGRLSLRVDAGPSIPADFAGDGTATVERASPENGIRDTLTLGGIWLGEGRGPPGPRPCQVVFSRTSPRRFFGE